MVNILDFFLWNLLRMLNISIFFDLRMSSAMISFPWKKIAHTTCSLLGILVKRLKNEPQKNENINKVSVIFRFSHSLGKSMRFKREDKHFKCTCCDFIHLNGFRKLNRSNCCRIYVLCTNYNDTHLVPLNMLPVWKMRWSRQTEWEMMGRCTRNNFGHDFSDQDKSILHIYLQIHSNRKKAIFFNESRLDKVFQIG